MKIIEFGNQSVTVELDPTDCFVLAQACEASVAYDQARNLTLAATLAAAFTAAGMAAAADFHLTKEELPHYTLAAVRKNWLPHDDRHEDPQ
jgi:hypothetical protein